MTVTLDPATEKLLQQEMAAGDFSEPGELIAHLLKRQEIDRRELTAARNELATALEEGASDGYSIGEDEMRARMSAIRTANPQFWKQ